MKRISRQLILLTLLFVAVPQLGTWADNDPDEERIFVENTPKFYEGFPPGVTGEVDRQANVLILQFHIPQKNVAVEIYDKGMLVTKDIRDVKSAEKVTYCLPKVEEGDGLVLITGDDGDVYGDKY